MAVAHGDVGDALRVRGDSAAALRSYEEDLAIWRMLADAQPANSQWQISLSLRHNKVGDAQRAQGDLRSALKSYQAALAIRKRLVASDPDQDELQLAFALSAWMVGTIEQGQSDAERLAILRDGLSAVDRLAQRRSLDPHEVALHETLSKAVKAADGAAPP